MNSAESEAAGVPPRLLEVIAGVVAETHPGRERALTLDSDFERDLGLDSLSRAELLLRVGQSFGTTLPDAALGEANTPRALLPFLGQSERQAREASALPGAGDVAALAAGESVPAAIDTLAAAFEWHAERHPQRLHVLLYGDAAEPQAITYGALWHDARSIAAGLAAAGLVPRQTVALMLPTSRDYLASFMGVMLAGGIPVPIYPPARLSQIEDHLRRHARILDNAQCPFLITVPQGKTVARLLRAAVPALREIHTPDDLRREALAGIHPAAPHDIAFLQYTSGSTGDPKGVVLTHANLLANLRCMGEAVRLGSGDVFVSWLPLYHDMGLIGVWLAPLYYGLPTVLMSPLAFLARPARWLQAIARHRGTISAAPNFAYELCARKIGAAELEGVDLSSWRIALNGAEPVAAPTLEAFAARFAAFGLSRGALFPAYGLAECCVGLAFPPVGRGPRVDRISRRHFAEERRAVAADSGSVDAMEVVGCGRAIPQHALRVVDELGGELPERHVGRLQFRGPSASAGYYRNPEATRRLLAGEWRETGDYAYLAEGELFLTGRVKDLIIRGGRNLYPYELEQAVGALPGVRKGCVAVFGCPDAHNGTERIVVVAETRETDAAARERLRDAINQTASDVMGMPADEVVLAPPHAVLKTSSGKIRRAASRELYQQGLIGAAGAPLWLSLSRVAAAAALARLRSAGRSLLSRLYGTWFWSVFALLAAPLWCVVAGLQRPDLGRRACHWTSRLMLRLAGLPWRAQGLHRLPARGHVLVVNHASYADAVYLVAALPPQIGYRFVAKREFLDHWLPRLFFTGIGTLFVERFDSRQGVEDADAITAALSRGDRVIVFPEGTFTRDPGLRRFRTGAFAAAARSGVPVAVAGLRGVRSMLREGSWLPRRSLVEVEIGAALSAGGDDWPAAMRLRDEARAEMLRLNGEAEHPAAAPDQAPL